VPFRSPAPGFRRRPRSHRLGVAPAAPHLSVAPAAPHRLAPRDTPTPDGPRDTSANRPASAGPGNVFHSSYPHCW